MSVLRIQASHTIDLSRLLVVRLLLVGVALPGLAVIASSFGLSLPAVEIATVVTIAVAITLASWWWSARLPHAATGADIAIQLGIDVAVLSAILYYTGGWTNPLVSLYLVPVAVAAATLPAVAAWTFAALGVLAYSLLTRFYVPVLHVHDASDPAFSLHVTGMWMTFVIAAALVAYFGSTMAATLRARERALVDAREQNLRNEQILGVATLAAGTAHELSTPLASIAVIASELENTTDGPVRDEVRTLLAQVDVCRGALNRLRDAAAPTNEVVSADRLLTEIRERFELLRPSVRVRFTVQSSDTRTPMLDVDATLRQALLNLLDNAANVSPRDVDLHGLWRDDTVEIDILDRGPGIFGAERPANGMGMGLLLANTSIERAGGSVHATPREGGGTRIRIRLPTTRDPEATR